MNNSHKFELPSVGVCGLARERVAIEPAREVHLSGEVDGEVIMLELPQALTGDSEQGARLL